MLALLLQEAPLPFAVRPMMEEVGNSVFLWRASLLSRGLKEGVIHLFY